MKLDIFFARFFGANYPNSIFGHLNFFATMFDSVEWFTGIITTLDKDNASTHFHCYSETIILKIKSHVFFMRFGNDLIKEMNLKNKFHNLEWAFTLKIISHRTKPKFVNEYFLFDCFFFCKWIYVSICSTKGFWIIHEVLHFFKKWAQRKKKWGMCLQYYFPNVTGLCSFSLNSFILRLCIFVLWLSYRKVFYTITNYPRLFLISGGVFTTLRLPTIRRSRR